MDTAHELVEAFTAAVPLALRELAGVEAVARRRAAGPGGAFDALSASIVLTSARGQGLLLLNLPERTAANLARRVLRETTEDVTPELIADCMGEVANVVAGQAKALLVGSRAHFTLSTPRVGPGPAAGAGERRVIWFDSDAGEFAVSVCPAREAGPESEG